MEDFYAERARQQIGVVANLRAKGFVDEPGDTGLGEEPAIVHLELGDGRTVDVSIGRRLDRRLMLRTSLSEQLYLVSGHLHSSLVPEREHMRAPPATAGAPHEHAHDAPASEVPTEMLDALRQMAQAQAR